MSSQTAPELPVVTMTNTKKEMLEAYELLKEKLEQQAESELKPEKALQTKKEKAVIASAESVIAGNDVIRKIFDVKTEIGRFFDDMAAKLESEKTRYAEVKEAVEIRKNQLQEIYEIESAASSLAALLEAQKLKKLSFEEDLERRRTELEEEIKGIRSEWEKERQKYTESMKEQKAEDEKKRKRDQEEFSYTFNREKDLKIRQLNDEMEKLNREIASRKEESEKQFSAQEQDLDRREREIAERENYLSELQKKVDQFPAELKKQVDAAVMAAVEKMKNDAAKNEEILIKGYEGEKNVLKTQIESLEKLAAGQQKQIEMLERQIDSAYGKVQDIAVKAVSAKSNEFRHISSRESSENQQRQG